MSLEVFLNHDSDERYEELAARMNMSAGALRMAVLRMRKKYRALLRAQIADTVARLKKLIKKSAFFCPHWGGGNV